MINARFKALIACLLVLAVLTPVFGVADIDPAFIQEELLKTSPEVSYTAIHEINGKNYIVYAQNSPDWGKITAGVKGDAPIKTALCSVFSLSNIIVNCVPYKNLDAMLPLMIREPNFDTKTVAYNRGYNRKFKFVVNCLEDYLRYYPLCLANMISGNVRFSAGDVRSRGYYEKLLTQYGLEYVETQDLEECIELVRQGAMASVCTGGGGSPIAPNFGHYFVMASVDDEYVYFLDSVYRDKYKYDKKHVIEIVTPGVFRVTLENVTKLSISGSKFVVWPDENRTNYTDEMLEEAIRVSNEKIPERPNK